MITEKSTIKCEAIFNDSHTHRYLWKRVWDKDKPIISVIMLNPCQADNIITDTTTSLVVNNVAKLQEYKPLAKVEELEEGNYNKIDGLIDTSEKNNKVEYEKKAKGISIKNKLAEKKAEIERKMKKKECEPSKKSQATVNTFL